MATKMSEILSDSTNVLESYEAEIYVDSTMSTQRAVKVDSPAVNGKKRHLSCQESCDSSPKKVKNDLAEGSEAHDGDETGEASLDDSVDGDLQERAQRRASRQKQ